MIDQSFWKPGSIVKLKEPFKPNSPSKGLLTALLGEEPVFPRYYYTTYWTGFTHGIIVQIVSHGQKKREVSTVSLHLYDPLRCVIYTHDACNGIPTYVDFHVDELVPWKDGAVLGYTPIEE